MTPPQLALALAAWISLTPLSCANAQPHSRVDTLHADTTSIPEAPSSSLSGNQEGPLPLDLSSCAPGTKGFVWEFGSVQVAIHGRTADTCQVDYTLETEGGYTTYHCGFLVADSTRVFPADPQPSLPDSTRCTVVRTGNVFFEQ